MHFVSRILIFNECLTIIILRLFSLDKKVLILKLFFEKVICLLMLETTQFLVYFMNILILVLVFLINIPEFVEFLAVFQKIFQMFLFLRNVTYSSHKCVALDVVQSRGKERRYFSISFGSSWCQCGLRCFGCILQWTNIRLTTCHGGADGICSDLLSCVQAVFRCWSASSWNHRCYGRVDIRVCGFLVNFRNRTRHVIRTVSGFVRVIFGIR